MPGAFKPPVPPAPVRVYVRTDPGEAAPAGVFFDAAVSGLRLVCWGGGRRICVETVTIRATDRDCRSTSYRNAYPALNVRPASQSPINFAVSPRVARGRLSGRIGNYHGLDGPFGIRALSVGILEHQRRAEAAASKGVGYKHDTSHRRG
jgi:hypothetical protein